MFRKLMKRKYNSVVLTQVLRRIVEFEALKRVHKQWRRQAGASRGHGPCSQSSGPPPTAPHFLVALATYHKTHRQPNLRHNPASDTLFFFTLTPHKYMDSHYCQFSV